MRSTWTWFAACVLAAVTAGSVVTVSVVSAFSGTRHSKSRRATASAEADRMPASHAEASRKPVGRPSRPRPPPTTPTPEVRDEMGPRTPEPSSAQSEGISSEDYRQFVDTVFASQSPDPTWSRDAAIELAQSLVPLVESDVSKATRVECRRDLCRFEVRNRDAAAYRAALTTTLHQRVWSAGMMLTASPSDPTTLIVYVAKKGESIPSPTTEQAGL